MTKNTKINLSDAMLQRGRTPAQSPTAGQQAQMPVSEMPMVLTLDQLRPNPDNPRTSKNPKFEEIKDSIRRRGLDSIPKVTRDPDGDDAYIFSDGGNTRYQILCDLWQETGEDRFYRLQTIFKPWPGRLQCVIGHLAENEVRGDLTYIEKSFGIHKARTIWEEELGRTVTLRELSELLNQQGYPIHNSTISRMEDTLKYLYPLLPDLLDSGMPRIQVLDLLTLRSTAEKTWKIFSPDVSVKREFVDVFSDTCCVFNNPESYSLEMFRDELIGCLLKALPHPSLNYDRWLIELDPKEQKRREIYGEPTPPPQLAPVQATENLDAQGVVLTDLQPQSNGPAPITGLRSGTLTGDRQKPEPSAETTAILNIPPLSNELTAFIDGGASAPQTRTEIQTDLYGGPEILSGETSQNIDLSGITLFSAMGEKDDLQQPQPSSIAFAASGLEPVTDIWQISALQDDIEHLQDIAYRLAFELAEAMKCESSIYEDKSVGSAGYTASPNDTNEFAIFLLGMTGNFGDKQLNMFMFCLNFIGSASKSDTPVFGDIHVVKVMRLIRVLRRLRELQREAVKGAADDL